MADNDIHQRIFLTCDPDWLTGDSPLQSMLSHLNLLGLPGVEIVGHPLTKFEIAVPPGVRPPVLEDPKTGVVQLLITSRDSLEQFLKRVEFLSRADNGPQAGADLGFNVSDYVDYWCPAGAGAAFGTRQKAIRQLKADSLQSIGGPKLDGNGVNIVLVDRGIAADAVPAANRGWGWAWNGQWPFTATGDLAEHTAMLTRDILAIAPDAVFYDMPLIPPRVQNVPAFLADVWAAFTYWMPLGMAFYDTLYCGRRWVIVNAWATFDLRSDVSFFYGPYRNNPSHPVHAAVTGLVSYPSDVIFAAGNCGQFCPDSRCGPADIGHGNSISGANGYQEVLSVGAVRADGLALGYSSQGPGRIPTFPQKPDVVTPSQYRLETDPSRISSGTSAACGLAAGVVAALRTRPGGPGNVGTDAPPADVITALRTSAGGTFDLQFGRGMLNAKAAGQALGIIGP